LPGPRRRRDAGGPRGGGVHQQSGGGEAPGLGGIPEQARHGRDAGDRPVRGRQREPRRGPGARRQGGDSVTARTANVLPVLGLPLLMASVSLTAPRWSRYFRQPLPVTPDEPRS